MKPVLRQITTSPQSSFLVRRDTGDALLNNWHYHPEIELLYMKKSGGTWLIGDHIGHFQNGDIVLLGANLPHCFRHEHKQSAKKAAMDGEAICVKFVPEIFGDRFFELPETKEIKELLTKCNRGLKLTGKIKKTLTGIIENMLVATPGKKLIQLLLLLEEIADSKAWKQLSSAGFVQSSANPDNNKIRLVFDYTFTHYNEKILLDDVAALLNMTKQSFCRYFKNKTRKTYVQFLMEVRVGYACRLLTENEKNVSEICYECGYNNISHFNHQFKTITKKSPLNYKTDYLKMQNQVA